MPVLSTLGAATAKAWGFLQQAAGGAADLYFNYVTMLLTGNGTNGAQNNTFLDSSTNAFSITRNGNTTQGSFSPYGPNWSNYFDNSSYFTLPDSSAWAFGTGDFTIEGWWYPTSNSGVDQFLFVQSNNSSPSGSAFQLWLDTSGVVNIAVYTAGGYFILSDSSTIPFNKWNHVAVVRTSSTLSFYVNGVRVATDTIGTDSVNDSAQTVAISARNNGNNKYKGYTSNLRVIKGSGPYNATQSTLTVPTTALTAITNTVLLTCQSNRFIDNSTNAFTLTASGTPSVQRFSPFNPTASYDTATIGGSGYFDGSGDYLNVATSGRILSNYSCCVEAWAYPTVSDGGNYETIIGQWASSGYSFICQFKNSKLRLYCADESGTFLVFNADATIPVGTWSHLAFIRNGNTWYGYVNGVQIVSASNSRTLNDVSTQVNIGRNGDNSEFVTGILSDVRIVVGSTVYDTSGNFTPPTAPLTAISGTRVLTNFINAGIPDSAMMNDLETVGNAQVSTSVKKFGTGSIAFDGTGDWLIPATNTSLYAFGTGNFTIEFWVNATSFTQYASLIDFRPASTNGYYPAIYFDNTSGTLVYHTNDAARITAGSNLSTGTWYHIAVCRSGTSTKMFINGTQTGSTYTDSNNYICGASRPIIGSNGYSTSYNFNGYIDDLRISNYARYTTNFTAPTEAFPTY